VNGAGGGGGSITLLCDERAARKRALVREVEQGNPAFRNIPVSLSRHGLRVWRSDGKAS
jgi:D-glycero-alpha-D-manno-heptose-7-phosphate kinase